METGENGGENDLEFEKMTRIISGIVYDTEEMKLKKSFKRLMDFAQTKGFDKSWNNVLIVKENSINRYFGAKSQKNEILKSALFTLEEYEKHFDETLLKQGHSWINLHLLGLLKNDLILSVELPTYKNDVWFTSVNLSLCELRIIENDWQASYFYEIV